jgi:hypothetical protein
VERQPEISLIASLDAVIPSRRRLPPELGISYFSIVFLNLHIIEIHSWVNFALAAA